MRTVHRVASWRGGNYVDVEVSASGQLNLAAGDLGAVGRGHLRCGKECPGGEIVPAARAVDEVQGVILPVVQGDRGGLVFEARHVDFDALLFNLLGKRRSWKKAYVCLAPGQEINFGALE